MSLADPELFNRTTLVKSYVSHVVQRLALEGAWQIEVAASLHTLGLVALPAELARRAPNGPPLDAEQKRQLATHPETTQRILEAIPRLEDVALIVGQQAVEATQGPEWVRRGARLLRVAARLEARVARGATLRQALEALSKAASEEQRSYIDALWRLSSDAERMESRELCVRDLVVGMILDCDVQTRDGSLVLAKGHELNSILLARLANLPLCAGCESRFGCESRSPKAREPLVEALNTSDLGFGSTWMQA